MEKVRHYKTKEYALYKGDKYIGDGTIRELSDKYGYTIKSLQWYNCKAAKKRFENCLEENHLILVPLDDDE